MNIGIDAYYLYSEINTGIGYYVLNLLLELSKIDNINNYFLYTPRATNKTVTTILLKNPRFHIIEVNNFLSNSRRLWLQHPSLKKQIKKYKVNFFFGGGEYTPVFLPSTIKVGITIHDVVFKIFPKTVSIVNKIFYYTLFQLCLLKSNFIFTVSNSSKQEIKKYLNIKNKNIYVTPNGIPIKNYLPKAKLYKQNYILFVGTLQPRKNLINLLKAYTIIHGQIKERLVIVGASGWKNSSLVEYIESLPVKIRKKIEFKGYINDKSLFELYRKAKLFVAPSLHEGFGLIILEALASGTPVVTSKTGAIPEYFSKAVLFADPLSPEDIGKKIMQIIKNKNIQARMINKGLTVAKKYKLEIMAKKYLKAFKEINNNCKK